MEQCNLISSLFLSFKGPRGYPGFPGQPVRIENIYVCKRIYNFFIGCEPVIHVCCILNFQGPNGIPGTSGVGGRNGSRGRRVCYLICSNHVLTRVIFSLKWTHLRKLANQAK